MSTPQSPEAPGKRQSIVPKPPHDLNSPGDCILRSNDGVQFKAFRNLLSLGSTVFADMFNMPQPPTNSEDDTSDVIQLNEDSHVVHTLLTLLYPVELPIIDSYDLAADLVVACDKYGINATLLKPHLNQSLQNTKGLETDPLGVYAIAWRMGLEEEAKNASRYTHAVNLWDRSNRDTLIRRAGSIEALLELHHLRLRREEGLDAVLIQMETRFCHRRLSHNEPFPQGYDNHRSTGLWEMKKWLRTLFDKPHPDLREVELYLQGRSCESCPARSNFELTRLQAGLAAALEQYPLEIQSLIV